MYGMGVCGHTHTVIHYIQTYVCVCACIYGDTYTHINSLTHTHTHNTHVLLPLYQNNE